MSVTICNDSGGGLGTKILDDEGNDICGTLFVESISINDIKANTVNHATVVLGVVKLELKCADIQWVTKNPITNDMDQISSITFLNGDHIDFDDRGSIYCNGVKIIHTDDNKK